jgi:hypothetical protein
MQSSSPDRPPKALRRLKKPAVLVVSVLLVVTFSPALRYRNLKNDNPLPTEFSKGVFHLHTTFSDGKGDLEEITAVAADRRLDFVVLADHGTTNLEAVSATRWVNGVLVVGGSELFLEGAHLAVAGISAPGYRYPPEPREAINEVNRHQGISFIAHPFFYAYPWTDWGVEGVTGIELINAHTMGSRPRLEKLLLVPRYFARPVFALLTTLEYPDENVAAWERMNQRGRHSGIFALDAHARLSMGFGRYINLPTYGQMFSLLSVYVKHGGFPGDGAETAASSLVAAMKAGSFFNCIEAIAPANGFDAHFESDTGDRVEMGGASASDSGRLLITLPFEFATDVVVVRNGEVFREFTDNTEPSLAVDISQTGVYRVEVSARESVFNHLPWIMSNPFFLATEKEREAPQVPAVRRVLASGPGFFRAECDPTSECSLVKKQSFDGEPTAAMRYALPQDPTTRDFSATLSNRTPRSFSGFDGLVLRARSSKRARFWLMFRTQTDGAESWYRRSFAADTEWSIISVPFEEFRVNYGEVRPPNLEDVTSMFISIDNQIAYPGASGTVFISDLGLF